MNDEHDELATQRPSALIATTVVTLVLAASAVFWRNHSRDERGRVISPNPGENTLDVDDKEERSANKPARSKDRRRRGRDPMKELLKGGKKAKELNKLIDTISLDPSMSSQSQGETSRSRSRLVSEPRSTSNIRDASVSSFVSTSSRTDEDHDHEGHIPRPVNEERSSSSTIHFSAVATSNNSTTAGVIPSNNSRPSLSFSPVASTDSSHLSTHKRDYESISGSRTRSQEHVSVTNKLPSLKPSHSLPPSSSSDPPKSPGEGSLVLPRGQNSPNPQLNTAGSHGLTNNTDIITASVPDSMVMPKPEGNTSGKSLSAAADSGVKRGRKRNKSPVGVLVESGASYILPSGAQLPPAPSTPTADGQAQSPLSTQTQLASLRGALEAARLREEKTRVEIEALRWEVEMARRKESDYHAYTNHLAHQLHSYASYVMSMQMHGGQSPLLQQHPHLSPYAHPMNMGHSPAGSIGSNSASGSGSNTNEHSSPAFSASQFNSRSRPSSRAGTPLKDVGPLTSTPGTSLPSPPPSDTVSSPALPPAPLPPPSTQPPYQIYSTTQSEQSAHLPEEYGPAPGSQPLLTPTTSPFVSPSLVSPISPQMSPFPFPWGHESMAGSSPFMSGMSHINYGFNGFPPGHFRPPMAMGVGSIQDGGSQGQSRSKSRKKPRRDKDRNSVAPPVFSDTTNAVVSTPPSPNPANDKFDVGSLLASNPESSGLFTMSSPSSSIPSTPSSRSRSQQSHHAGQHPMGLAISEAMHSAPLQSPSPLEVLGLSMDRLRETSSRARTQASREYPGSSVDLFNSSHPGFGPGYIHSDETAARPDDPVHDESNGYDGQDESDAEGGAFSGPLADAILKRPETMRTASRRREDQSVRGQEVPRTETTIEDEEGQSSTSDTAEEIGEDPIMEFTFPTLSNWANVGSGTTKDTIAKEETRPAEIWDERAPSSPPPTPPSTKDNLDCQNA
ncbi:hypothetical protein PQX77_005497 [Marasmius sp. AFHP31]|nr:hypothetical protein PQX77_005497 [Marasmius sp. AFHP31]